VKNLETELIARYQDGTLIAYLAPAPQAGSEPSNAELLDCVVGLHNSGQLDILAATSSIATTTLGSLQLFAFQNIFCKLLPRLGGEPADVLSAVSVLLAGDGHRSAGFNFNALCEWCAREGRAEVVLELVPRGSKHEFIFLVVALQGGALYAPELFVQKSIQYLNDNSEYLRSAALTALGAMRLEDRPDLLEAALTALLQFANATDDDESIALALFATVAIHAKAPAVCCGTVLKVLSRAGAAGHAKTHERLAGTMRQFGEKISESVLDSLLGLVNQVAINPELVDGIDHVAYGLIKAGKQGRAAALVADVLTAHPEGVPLKQFDSFTHEITHGHADEFAKLVIDWLMTGVPELGKAASDMIGSVHATPVVFNVDLTSRGLRSVDAGYLARKIIGYLFMHPIAAASLLLSLLRSQPADGSSEILALLFDPLLINFSGGLAEYLEGVKADATDSAASDVRRALKKLEDYLDKLRAVDRIKELDPSERERSIERHQRQIEMRKVYETVEETSIFRSIASRSVILYGNRSINYVRGISGEQQRLEIKMNTHSHTIETPRMLIVDPTGLDWRLFGFRTEKPPE
jgi:hypothetical protein